MVVTVIGTGYVGTVTGACLAYLGHQVTCVDSDRGKIEKLQRGESPIYEPGLEALLAVLGERGALSFTTELSAAVRKSDVIFIAVGTPPGVGGEANLSQVEAAAHSIGAAMDEDRFRVVVNKSTVPVGCGNLVEMLVKEGIAARTAGERPASFGVASNPEFLREGSAVLDSLYPDRIVVGTSDERSLAILRELYAPIVAQDFEAPPGLRPPAQRSPQFFATTLTSAEMIKYAANTFLAMKIGFANEVANICERVGADALEVMTGVGLDSRIGAKFLNPGIGWGGSCFGKDIQALLHTAHEYGYSGKLLTAAYEVNYDQRQIVFQKLQEHLRILKGRTIALLGLAFKPDTDDLRDAPSLYLAERLLQAGSRVRVYDPIAMPVCREQHPELKVVYCDSARAAATDADALVIVTEWRQFGELNLRELAQCMAKPILIDARNVFSPAEASAAGFQYSGIGRGSVPSSPAVAAYR